MIASGRFSRICRSMVSSSLALLMVSIPGSAQQPSSRPAPGTDQTKAANPRPSGTPQLLEQLNSSLVALVEKVSPAVVQIQVTGYGAVEESNHRQTALVVRQRAIGSGVIVDPSGYIITNAHVVEGARRIRVLLPMPSEDVPQVQPVGKERIEEAKLIGVHKESDLALIKIDAKGLATLSLGSARPVRQGQLVLAMGSPEAPGEFSHHGGGEFRRPAARS